MIDDLRALLSAANFHPLKIKLKTGRIFEIVNREYAWVRPGGIIHLVDPTDNQLYILNPREIDWISAPEKAATDGE